MAISYFDLTEAQKDKVIEIVAEAQGYAQNARNGETKKAFVLRLYGEMLVESALRHREQKVAMAAIASDTELDDVK